ncbi:hypothetical protein ACVNP1_15560 [Staphylococcus aureus]
MSYFFNLLSGIGYTDDIDHSGNRRLRSVGELLQTNSVSSYRMERVLVKECGLEY